MYYPVTSYFHHNQIKTSLGEKKKNAAGMVIEVNNSLLFKKLFVFLNAKMNSKYEFRS